LKRDITKRVAALRILFGHVREFDHRTKWRRDETWLRDNSLDIAVEGVKAHARQSVREP
jgi:hypothetical protein